MPYDDIINVNKRRENIGLNTLEEQILLIRERVEFENQSPPIDFKARIQEYDLWRRSVGWIN